MRSANFPEYKYSEAADTYESVADEYYDERLHPTCADFRSASTSFLERFFRRSSPKGRIADIGCGRSLVANFYQRDLVLIDASARMLGRNPPIFEKRKLNVERESIGTLEFDWIFAVLGDPYNSPNAWQNIASALKRGGECVFIVPSYKWAQAFRPGIAQEKLGFARFVTGTGNTIYLRSLILRPEDQAEMISDAGLAVTSVEDVLVRELASVRSAKIYDVLAEKDALLDVYRATKL